MQKVTSGGRKGEAVGEDGSVPGKELTAWSPGTGQFPAQCGTFSPHQTEP